MIFKIYNITCCTWLFLKNDVYAKYINLKKSGLKKSKKKRRKKHWLAMLCEQTEERGNFIIFTSLAAVPVLPFLYSKLQTSLLFAKKKKKKMLENKLSISVARFAAASCQSKCFFLLWYLLPRLHVWSMRYIQVRFAQLILDITRSALDMKVSECNSCERRNTISEVNVLTSG